MTAYDDGPWRKLSPKELAAVGYPPKSERYTTTAKGGNITAEKTISKSEVVLRRRVNKTLKNVQPVKAFWLWNEHVTR